jgi:hypothetical protein
VLCWSCGKTIPDDAKSCRYCEAAVEPEPTEEEIAAVQEVLAGMSPDVLEQIEAAFADSENAEDFVNRIMVGECPKCGSPETSDCENDPEINDPCVGRCFQCGQLWCLDCGQRFKQGKTTCRRCSK